MFIRKVAPGTGSRLTIVDHNETYGRHILKRISRGLNVSLCVDLGCGAGDDLRIIKANNPAARCFGIDYDSWNKDKLLEMGIEQISVNIETEHLPFEDESVDFIVANQVFEHTKEIFWINHEIFRSLKVGGYLYLGVPNVLSLHNRILSVFGYHPTCCQMLSVHVRAFSKKDTLIFYKEIAGSFTSLAGFYGSQFYPFPGVVARYLSRVFPTCAVAIFFLIKKTGPYNGQFLHRVSQNVLETKFFYGQ